MSTKIYIGWRCKVADLSPRVLPSMREKALKEAALTVKAIIKEFKPKHIDDAMKTSGKRLKVKQTPLLRKIVTLKAALTLCAKASESQERSEYDIDASCNVWVHGKHAYIIPYGECWTVDWMPNGAEDYSWYNNVDKPKDVTAFQWKAREANWRIVCLDEDWDSTRMVHTIIDAKKAIGLVELAGKLVRGLDNQYRVLPS